MGSTQPGIACGTHTMCGEDVLGEINIDTMTRSVVQAKFRYLAKQQRPAEGTSDVCTTHRAANLIKSDITRQILFGMTAAVFVLIAVRAALFPQKMASGLGYSLSAPNGYSEMYAVYVGVWGATAALALVALFRVKEALLGDLLAVFVLAQPIARLLALTQWGMPQGNLFVMFIVEVIGGVVLLLVRPSA